MAINLSEIRAKMADKKFSISMAKGDDTKAEILIYAEIGASFWGDGVSAKSFSDELDALAKTVKEITVRVNSPGGDVFDGITIYNRLKQHKAKIIVKVDGMAASIASIIMLAGDEIIMGEGAMMMVHKPWTGVWGNSDDLDHTSNVLLQLEEQMLGIYQRRSSLSREELSMMLKDETWISAEDAMKYGFADKIEGEAIPVAASVMDKGWLKKSPKNLITIDDVAKKEISENISKIDAILNNKNF